MEQVLGSGVLQVGGPAAILLVIITILFRLWIKSEDRAKELESRLRHEHAAEVKRLYEAHDAELAELKSDIAELRRQVDGLNVKLDEERALRRQAQDDAARALREAGGGHA